MSAPTAPRQRRWIWYVILPVLAALLIWAGDSVYHALRVYQDARQAQSLLARGLSKQTLSEGIPLLHDTYQEFSALEKNLRPLIPLMNWLGSFPGPGKYAAQAEPLLTYTRSGLLALDLTLQGLAPILQASNDGQPSSSLEKALAQISSNRTNFTVAADVLDETASARKRIQVDLLPGQAQEIIHKVDAKFNLAQGGLVLLSSLPQLAGIEQEQTYLLAAQNSDELRPTGGFISALGLIKVKSGQIISFNMQDSFAVDDYSKNYPYPPEPIQHFMLAGYWVPRDANWYADFPSSARKLQELYELSTGQKTSGVIAFDQSAVAGLLQELGPQQMEGLSAPLTGANVVDWMRQAWSPQPGKGVDPAWWAQRKNFIGTLGKMILAQVNSLQDEQKAASIAAAGYGLLSQGHIQVYLNEERAQTGLAQAGLAGGARPEPGTDFLMLVDTNIGFNKVDALLKRSIEYRLNLSDPAHPSAQFTASYANLAQQAVPCKQEAAYGENYSDLEQRCYWDYWRVLTSPGSQLKKALTPTIPAEQLLDQETWDGQVSALTNETGLGEFAGLIVLGTNSTGSYQLEWNLPGGILKPNGSGWVYRLRIQKQAGLASLPVTVQVLPPDGCSAVNSAGWTAKSNQMVWMQNILESVILELEFRCP